MKKTLILLALTVILFGIHFSCERQQANEDNQNHRQAHDDDTWLSGTNDEKFHTLAGQLRGFDVAMIELGYRYSELYFAGKNENWEFADYQLEHITEVLDYALERRPARSASANDFLENAVPAMQEAINSRSSEQFGSQFRMFTNACNSCHAREDHGFIQITQPQVKLSPAF